MQVRESGEPLDGICSAASTGGRPGGGGGGASCKIPRGVVRCAVCKCISMPGSVMGL